MRHRLGHAALVGTAVCAVGLSACGGGSGGGGSDSSSGGGGQKAASGSGSGSSSSSGGGQAAAKGTLSVTMADYSFKPSTVTAKAGKLDVTVKNAGQQQHEFVLLRTDRAPGQIPVKNGEASEAGLVGKIGEQQPGASASHTFRLKPGKYVFVCNVTGHYQAGMRGSLIVK